MREPGQKYAVRPFVKDDHGGVDANYANDDLKRPSQTLETGR